MKSVVIAAAHQVSTDLKGEVAILNTKKGAYFGLDRVGATIWNLIQEARTVEQVRDAILQKYDVDLERCEHDLLALLKELRDEGLIEVQHAVAS